MKWSLDGSYTDFALIEDDFNAALDESMHPHGPGQLYDVVAGLGLPRGSAALDVGCGEGDHAAELAARFGFAVTGIDPVPRHVEMTRAAGVVALRGVAESIPCAAGSADLVWCRDVLVHVADLDRAYAEFRRVLRPGGRAVVYQMFGTELLEPREGRWLWETMGVVPESADPARTEAAIAAAGFTVDQCLLVGSEWGEWTQETSGHPGRKLLQLSRLRRDGERWIARYGQFAYDMMLGDCLWQVYAMLGKLSRRVYVLTAPGPG